MKDTANDISLPPPDAARYLALSSSWLAKRRCYGGGPRFCKLGRRVTYRRSDLDVWREQTLAVRRLNIPSRSLLLGAHLLRSDP